jgi:hypothetical protein
MDCFEADYPAAHSMDTSWFAVDEAGRVAIFDSGEDGAVPFDALSLGGASDPDPEAERVWDLLAPESELDLELEGPFFRYVNGDYGDPGRYVRSDHTPAHPADIATLPEGLRERMLRLPVDFMTAQTVHLAEFMADEEAATWADTTLRGQPLPTSTPARSSGHSSGPAWIVLILVALVTALLLGILTAS